MGGPQFWGGIVWAVACCGLLDVAERGGLRLQVRLKMGLWDFCAVLSAARKYIAVAFSFSTQWKLCIRSCQIVV